jgi:hypothetical protein
MSTIHKPQDLIDVSEKLLIEKLPSELIRMVIQDMKALENRPEAVFNMSNWGVKDDYGTCFVCVAGAFFYNRFDVLLGTEPDFGRNEFWPVNDLAYFFDFVRKGYLDLAFKVWYDLDYYCYDIHADSIYDAIREAYFECLTTDFYENDPDQFFASLERRAYIFEQVGL